MPAAVVEMTEVSFCRNDRQILSGVSWRIDAGRHWALLGANGSGKTTLLKILTGYEWPSSGLVHVLGERFGDCDIRRLRKLIGWVSSAMTQRLPERDTALEVVASGLDASIGLYRHVTGEEYEKSLAVLKQLRAESIATQRYGTLSQGEMQKVLIARSLVAEPKVLILDEPCIGLDPATRQRFLTDLALLSRSDAAPTIILVTHHIEEIGPWIQNVMLLKDGMPLAQGLRDEVITSERMQALLGCVCSVLRQGDRLSLCVE